MKPFKKAAIIGTGLIGGSLALAIRKKRLAKTVVGVSRHKESIRLAVKMGAIDSGSTDMGIIMGADLVIFASPVDVIVKQAPIARRFVGRGCLVTDVGSTKEGIVRHLEKIFPGYVGSHPLAGSEKRGIAHAAKGLFEDSLCLVTPTRKSCPQALKRVISLWRFAGAKVRSMPPAAHDKALSAVSHLPHAVAFALIEAVADRFLPLASGGLKDTTRIAASDSEIWADIFLSNRKNLLKDIALFEEKLLRIKRAVSAKDKRRLSQVLSSARKKRETLG